MCGVACAFLGLYQVDPKDGRSENSWDRRITENRLQIIYDKNRIPIVICSCRSSPGGHLIFFPSGLHPENNSPEITVNPLLASEYNGV